MWPFGNKETKTQKVVNQKHAGGAVITRFIAIKDFECPDTGSAYVKGMTYNIRAGNDPLQQRVNKWLGEGKVRYL